MVPYGSLYPLPRKPSRSPHSRPALKITRPVRFGTTPDRSNYLGLKNDLTPHNRCLGFEINQVIVRV
jgi:hypothetical protein